MLIDAHQHFWIYSAEEYPWIDEPKARLKRDYLPEDLQPLLSAAGLTHSIVVQARQSLAETHWLLELASGTPSLYGVVGWVDLRAPDVAEQLATLASNPKFLGVRHVAQDEPDDRFLMRDDVRRGIAAVTTCGLAYDLLIYPRQMPAAIELVQRHPEQRFVLDHLAKPEARHHAWQPWADQLAQLASLPNVACKLSGLVTEANWETWTPDELRPYLEWTCQQFGEDRLMIGSDWPVCLLAAEYHPVIDLSRAVLEQLSPTALPKALGPNVQRWYHR